MSSNLLISDEALRPSESTDVCAVALAHWVQLICERIPVIRVAVADADVLVHSKRTDPIRLIQPAHFRQKVLQESAILLQKFCWQAETAFLQGIRQHCSQQVAERVAPIVGHHDLCPFRTILVES